MSNDDVFSRERNEIAHAKNLLEQSDPKKDDIRSELATVTAAYERSLRRAERITKISDRNQRRIAEKRERLRAIRKVKVANGVFWIEIPEVDLRVLCGCPADAVKLLIKRGLIINTEQNGVTFETGPNAILLSDFMIQNGQIANLAEFPVLQMLYRQGMLIPNHPNNTGAKPILIGLDDVLRAQSQYIYRGNYGLTTQQELEEAGVESSQAEEMMRLKLKFAFDSIKTTDELIDLRPLDRDVIALTDEVFLHRLGSNRYEFIWEGQRVEVDLNLGAQEEYESAYHLGDHSIDKEYFSVVHIGEGDGWDVNRPCMASLLTYQDKFYLIDAGPKVMDSLTALGISINEIDGLFHTHGHDDHFAGLAALLRSDHRLKYYATPLVRASVTKKLAALMSIDESSFGQYFEICDLKPDEWNDIDGLEVMPIFSPHPVETNIYQFRVRWLDGYRTYAHLADIASCSVLLSMVTDDSKKSGLSHEAFERAKSSYLIPADLKKIDIGGGLIHGDAEDFEHDTSEKILLAHKEQALSEREREIGSNASFGMQDILIPSVRETIIEEALNYLREYYPDVPLHEIVAFTNYPIESFNAGSIVIRKGDRCAFLYLIIRGVIEGLDARSKMAIRMTAGALVGEISGVEGDASSMTYRTASYIKALRIPLRHYSDFVRRNGLLQSILDARERIAFLQSTTLFDEAMSYQTLFSVARTMKEISFPADTSLSDTLSDCIFLVATGGVRLSADGREIESVSAGEVCGETCMLLRDTGVMSAVTVGKTTGFAVPATAVDAIPIVRWKLLEVLKRRVQKLTTLVKLEWTDDYVLDDDVLDEQHKSLFISVRTIYDADRDSEGADGMKKLLQSLLETVTAHYQTEEEILERVKYPELDSHRSAHAESLDRLTEFATRAEKSDYSIESDQLEHLKNWLVNHMLVEDSGLRGYVGIDK
jgi:hemerythrin